jgi:ribulose-phosphate 3-epimerase
MSRGAPQISASILNADFASLGSDVRRASAGGVDSIHLDVMDGHFVHNISFGAPVVAALRPHASLPFHSHLMISQPARYVAQFAEAGSNLIVFHVEADDDPAAVIGAVRAAGRQVGIALNPETPADAIDPYLAHVDLLLVMTVNPGWGGQPFIRDVLPKMRALRERLDRAGLDVPIGVDGGVKDETIGDAYTGGGEVLVVGSGLYRHAGDLAPVVERLRRLALGAAPEPARP